MIARALSRKKGGGANGDQSALVDGLHVYQLRDVRIVRLFNVIDDFNRESRTIEADLSLPAERVERVERALNPFITWRGQPQRIRGDSGPEYIGHVLHARAKQRRVHLDCIQSGKLQPHASVERYHGTVRYDWLSPWRFDSIADVQESATRWLWAYNHDRPNADRLAKPDPVMERPLQCGREPVLTR